MAFQRRSAAAFGAVPPDGFDTLLAKGRNFIPKCHIPNAVAGETQSRPIGQPPQLDNWIGVHTKAVEVGTKISPPLDAPGFVELTVSGQRPEERRVGKRCVSTWRSRWS